MNLWQNVRFAGFSLYCPYRDDAAPTAARLFVFD